jgi:hypothetical protein
MTVTAEEIQHAFVTIERHRASGPEQAPTCKCCGEPVPCRERIAASAVVHSVYTDAWAGR